MNKETYPTWVAIHKSLIAYREGLPQGFRDHNGVCYKVWKYQWHKTLTLLASGSRPRKHPWYEGETERFTDEPTPWPVEIDPAEYTLSYEEIIK